MTEKLKPSLRVLLAEIIDYAGLFPPAGLSMQESVAKYNRYLASEYVWMLGRFVCPVSRLDEFLVAADELDSTSRTDKTWRLSILAGPNLADTVESISRFNRENSERFVCDMIEGKAAGKEDIENAAQFANADIEIYLELELNEHLENLISAISGTSLRAKIRTGGITEELFPSAAEIIRFANLCISANVPFKATAGLHHPLNCFKPLSYEPDSPKGAMHGFLNVFLMTGFAKTGMDVRMLNALMNEDTAEALRFEDEGVRWRDGFLSNGELANLRESLIGSFGSCSFDEPVDDLKSLGVF